MQKIETDNTTLLQFNKLTSYQHIAHFVTTRQKGFSSGKYKGLNMGLSTGDTPEQVRNNRIAVTTAMNLPPQSLFFPKQTHSAIVLPVTKQTTPNTEADALITNIPGICICVQTADCIPILLLDTKQNAIGAIHAGWRGTMQHIVVRTIEAMQQRYNTQTKDIIAGIGPGISPEIYEVGEEVIEATKKAFPYTYQQLLTPSKNTDKAYLDLWKANFQLLTAMGVYANNIEIAGRSTYADYTNFYSARREGIQTGRLATGISLRQCRTI